MIKINRQDNNQLNSQAFQTQSHQLNPTLVAKALEELVDRQTGLFFSTLSKIPNTHLIDVLLELSNPSLYQALQRLSLHKVYDAMALTPSDNATDFLRQVGIVDKGYIRKAVLWVSFLAAIMVIGKTAYPGLPG